MGIFERRPAPAETKPRPTDIGAIYDAYCEGRHVDVRAAFQHLAPADAAGLAAAVIECAGNHVLARSTAARAALAMLNLCEYFRRWTA